MLKLYYKMSFVLIFFTILPEIFGLAPCEPGTSCIEHCQKVYNGDKNHDLLINLPEARKGLGVSNTEDSGLECQNGYEVWIENATTTCQNNCIVQYCTVHLNTIPGQQAQQHYAYIDSSRPYQSIYQPTSGTASSYLIAPFIFQANKSIPVKSIINTPQQLKPAEKKNVNSQQKSEFVESQVIAPQQSKPVEDQSTAPQQSQVVQKQTIQPVSKIPVRMNLHPGFTVGATASVTDSATVSANNQPKNTYVQTPAAPATTTGSATILANTQPKTPNASAPVVSASATGSATVPATTQSTHSG